MCSVRNSILRIIGFIILFAVPIVGRHYHPSDWPLWLVVILCGIAAIVIGINIHGIIKSDKNKRNEGGSN